MANKPIKVDHIKNVTESVYKDMKANNDALEKRIKALEESEARLNLINNNLGKII